MKVGVTISIVGHAALLAWGVISFAAKPLEASPVESLPVDIVSEKDFSKLTQGNQKAELKEEPKPLVEKEAEKKPVDDPTPKVSDKPEVVAAAESVPTPPPAPAKAEVTPDLKAEAKPDAIAETLKQEEAAKPEPKQADAKPTPMPQKRPLPVPPKFDPMKIAALLNKQEPRRQAAAGDRVNPSVSLGVAAGNAAQLSQSELDALRARLAQLWNPPVGARNPQDLVVLIRVQLTPDGKLAAPPMVLSTGKDPLFLAARESAVRAIFRGQPFDMLRRETYDVWKDIEITFDPRQMFPG